jgi:hypothetical protein
MSHLDSLKINRAYKCHGGGGGGHHGVFGNIGFGPSEEPNQISNGPSVSFPRNPFIQNHDDNNEIEIEQADPAADYSPSSPYSHSHSYYPHTYQRQFLFQNDDFYHL